MPACPTTQRHTASRPSRFSCTAAAAKGCASACPISMTASCSASLRRSCNRKAFFAPTAKTSKSPGSWVAAAMAADPDGKGGLAAWNNSRPPFVEAEAVHRVATLARQAGAPVYMVHCTSEAALEAALAQRSLGTDLTIETCTHYLTHTIDWKGGDIGKVGPPIRTASDVEALWAALKAGKIDVVATDHVHRHVAAKAGGIWKASPGFPGLQTFFPYSSQRDITNAAYPASDRSRPEPKPSPRRWAAKPRVPSPSAAMQISPSSISNDHGCRQCRHVFGRRVLDL